MNAIHGIYLLIDPETGTPFYVGKSKTRMRPEAHLAEARTGKYRHGNHLKVFRIKRILDAGLSVSIEWLATNLLPNQANALEIQTIAKYGRIDKGTGCLTNMTDGGDGNHESHTAEAKAKISQALRERDPEVRKRAAEKMRGRPGGMRGKTHTDERNQLMSEKKISAASKAAAAKRKAIKDAANEQT